MLVAGAMAVVAAQSASAAFSNGDLVLSFQATGGQGASDTIAANLGAGYVWRNNTANVANVINLGSLLTSTYGASWFDRTDLYICLNGVYAVGGSPVNQGGPVVNGDARNSTYVGSTKTDANAATYNQWAVTQSALLSAGNQMNTYNATVVTALASTNAAVIPTSTVNTIEDYTTPNSGGARLVNYTLFNNDFLQSFTTNALFNKDGTDYEGALSLQRINAYNGTTGVLTGNVVFQTNGVNVPVGSGYNLGYFGIQNNGQVDFYSAVPEPSTYALLALGAAGLGAHLIRRRRK